MSPWFERVPSPSNVADAPSRLDLSGLEGLGLIDDSAQVAAECSDVEAAHTTSHRASANSLSQGCAVGTLTVTTLHLSVHKSPASGAPLYGE